MRGDALILSIQPSEEDIRGCHESNQVLWTVNGIDSSNGNHSHHSENKAAVIVTVKKQKTEGQVPAVWLVH